MMVYPIVLYNDLYLLKMFHQMKYLLFEMVLLYVHVELLLVHHFENHMDFVNHMKYYYSVIQVLLMNVVVNKNLLLFVLILVLYLINLDNMMINSAHFSHRYQHELMVYVVLVIPLNVNVRVKMLYYYLHF